MFRAKLNDLDLSRGTESLEVKLFKEADIPWEQLALRTIGESLKHFFADRKTAGFPPHIGELRHSGR